MLQAFFANLHIVAALIAANYVLAIVCAVREVMASRTSQGSIAWLTSLLFLPFPMAFVYLILGWKHFDDYAKTRLELRLTRPIRAEELQVIDRDTGKQWPVLLHSAGAPFLAGNKPNLLIDGEATFASIFAGIAKAEHYILVQFYIFRDDRLGRQFADALIERAAAGVQIWLLYDDVGSSDLPASYKKRLRDAGINVAGFNQRHRFLRIAGPMRINYRNHRKVVLVDGKVAWTGGLNVGTEYLGENKRYGARWRDTHLRLEGPAALSFGMIYREDWQWATGEELILPPFEAIEEPGGTPALVMATGPADRIESCAIAFSDVIAQSRERLWVVSPYFVPDTDIRTTLYAAAMRGVDVRIMLPEKPDHLLVWLASNAHADAMVKHGIHVYRYTAGFLHQKVLLMDDRIVSVGSVNFDNRSFAINFEISVWMTEPQTVGAVEAMLLADFQNCRQVEPDEVATRSAAKRFINQAARLFSPIL
jgi:cardiolipin synthase A/B